MSWATVDMIGRFWRKVDKAGPIIYPELGRCWLWTGAKDKDGYGRYRRDDRAHRFAFRLGSDQLSTGQAVLHRCDNPPCVRLSHLFAGNALDNVRDRDRKKRGRTLRGELCHLSKLTASQVAEIRARRGSGERRTDLAIEFGIGARHIRKIMTREIWTSV